MYEIYIDLYKKYSTLYGSTTCIFLMVGSFYELYDIQDENGKTECNIKEIVDILGIQLTTKKDLPQSIKNDNGKVGLFAGVPEYTIHKWAGKLTAAGWSVVIVDQQKNDAGNVTGRYVNRVLSPSTHLEALGSSETAYILGLVLYEDPSLMKAPSFTAAAFDLSTGRTFTFYGQFYGRGDIWYSDEFTHFLQIFAPRELIIWWKGSVLSQPTSQTISKIFNLDPTMAIYVRFFSIGLLESSLLQDEYLRKLYSINSMLPVTKWLYISEIEKPGLLLLLKFIEEHMPSSFERLERNQQWTPVSTVRLGNSALNQLQMITPNIKDSILGLYDKCITPIGKRGIRRRILNPIWDQAILNKRLERIDNLQKLPSSIKKDIDIFLRTIYDIPRIHRRILCGTITASEIVNLHTTYFSMKSMIIIEQIKKEYNTISLENLEEVIQNLKTNFDFKKADFASEDLSFLHNHQFPQIENLENNIANIRSKIEEYKNKVATDANIQSDSILVDNKNNSLILRGPLKAMKAIQSVIEYKSHVHLLKSGGTLEHPQLQILGFKLFELQTKLKKAIEVAIPIACDAFVASTYNLWRSMEEWIECIDIDQCIARVSEDRGFTRPVFKTEGSEASEASLSFENLRHPLIESTLTRTEYIKHSVNLTQTSRGWLVYGMNASGKSSLMKSVGIAILLAQVGAYVPASAATIVPFHSIFTRILNQDNLWAGLSSFAVEMTEMREILSYADQNTLVLGDELCSGTESASAHALVAAGIEWLSQKKSKYIFATHLHGLLDILPSPHIISLSVFHLRVIYDAVKDLLIYERTLTPGPGHSLYGLEVARAMHVPIEYYEKALQYRQKFLGEKSLEEINKSSWNLHILRNMCEICGAGIKSHLEVHHIRQRMDANGMRFADGAARDDARNLVVVCDKCHDLHHSGKLQINPIQMTSAGPLRKIIHSKSNSTEYIHSEESIQFQENPSITTLIECPSSHKLLSTQMHRKRKSQWLPEQQAIINDFLKKYKTSPLKRIIILLKEEGIEITESSLRSMRNQL
jgi:DNA mismatch repair protein MutS